MKILVLSTLNFLFFGRGGGRNGFLGVAMRSLESISFHLYLSLSLSSGIDINT